MSSLHAEILTNPRFEREFRIILACFFKENAQLVKFFTNLEEKKIPFNSREHSIIALQERIQKQNKANRLVNSLRNSSGPRKLEFWVQKYKFEFI